MFVLAINKKKLAVSIIIALVAFVGDKNSENRSNRLVAAICDNTTHGLIGAFTWIGISIARLSHPSLYLITEITMCAILSSLMDLDHFIAAKSFHLKDAVQLKGRPPLHCTTLVIFIIVTFLCASHFCRLDWMYKFGWIVAAAFLSHHVRDSKRRGLWLWPLGSTPPIPTVLYIITQMILPHLFSILMTQFARSSYKNAIDLTLLEQVV